MRILFTCLLFTIALEASAQTLLELSLEEVVAKARRESPTARLSNTRLKNNYWRYRAFQADYRPQIRLTSTLPDFNRSIEPLTLDDGSVAFLERSFMTTRMGVALEQDVALTGGSVSVGASLSRNDNFLSAPALSYLSTPLQININQPLFQFNAMRWERKIEPVRYNEAQARSSEELEEAASQAVGRFFDVYIAQIQLEAANLDKANADTLFRLSQGRYNVGRIAENELLQVELQVMNADASLAQATLSLQSATEELRNALSINEAVRFKLSIPTAIPSVEIDLDTALILASKHRSLPLNHTRRRLEVERNVQKARQDNGVTANLNANFGLSKSAQSLEEAYINPRDQERVVLSLSVPLADWGKARSQREIAQSDMELEQMNIDLEAVNFEREIILNIKQFDLVRQQVELAERSYDVAQRSYEIAEKRYRIGKIGITDLNQALGSRNTARRSYFEALRRFWVAYFEIRRLTLYDFINNRPLVRSDVEFEVK